jgi:hypothetical protein
MYPPNVLACSSYVTNESLGYLACSIAGTGCRRSKHGPEPEDELNFQS